MGQQQEQSQVKYLTIAELCEFNDLAMDAAEKALLNLQGKGLVTGFVPGDVHATIALTKVAEKYFPSHAGADK